MAVQRANSYSNPAKLMNFIKMKKQIENTGFENVNHYVSHMEAFTKLSNKQSFEERDRQRTLLKMIQEKNNNTSLGNTKSSTSGFQR